MKKWIFLLIVVGVGIVYQQQRKANRQREARQRIEENEIIPSPACATPAVAPPSLVAPTTDNTRSSMTDEYRSAAEMVLTLLCDYQEAAYARQSDDVIAAIKARAEPYQRRMAELEPHLGQDGCEQIRTSVREGMSARIAQVAEMKRVAMLDAAPAAPQIVENSPRNTPPPSNYQNTANEQRIRELKQRLSNLDSQLNNARAQAKKKTLSAVKRLDTGQTYQISSCMCDNSRESIKRYHDIPASQRVQWVYSENAAALQRVQQLASEKNNMERELQRLQ